MQHGNLEFFQIVPISSHIQGLQTDWFISGVISVEGEECKSFLTVLTDE